MINLYFILGSHPTGQSYPMNIQQTLPHQAMVYPQVNISMPQPPPTYAGQEAKHPFNPQY